MGTLKRASAGVAILLAPTGPQSAASGDTARKAGQEKVIWINFEIDKFLASSKSGYKVGIECNCLG